MEREERKEKQKALEERWKLVRWLVEFIDVNTEKWGTQNHREFEKDIDIEKWENMNQEEKMTMIMRKETEKIKPYKEKDRDQGSRDQDDEILESAR